MGALVEHPIGFDETAVEYLFARWINGFKFHPGFVKVADFGRERVSGVAVGDDDFDGDLFAGRERYLICAVAVERGDHSARVITFESEDVYVQHVRFQKIFGGLHLSGLAVEERRGGVGSREAVRSDLALFGRAVVVAFDFGHVAGAAIGSLFAAVERQDGFVRRARLLPFVVSRKTSDVLVAVERWRRVDLVAGGAEFRRSQQRAHHRAFVGGNVGQNLLVGEVAVNRRPVFAGEQRGAADSEASCAINRGLGNRMADRTGHALVVERSERSLLTRAFLAERARKERDRRVAGFAVASEFYTARAEQDVRAFAVERLARRVAVQRFGPGGVRVLVAGKTARGGEEMFGPYQLAIFRARIRRTEGIGGRRRRRPSSICRLLVIRQRARADRQANAHQER